MTISLHNYRGLQAIHWPVGRWTTADSNGLKHALKNTTLQGEALVLRGLTTDRAKLCKLYARFGDLLKNCTAPDDNEKLVWARGIVDHSRSHIARFNFDGVGVVRSSITYGRFHLNNPRYTIPLILESASIYNFTCYVGKSLIAHMCDNLEPDQLAAIPQNNPTAEFLHHAAQPSATADEFRLKRHSDDSFITFIHPANSPGLVIYNGKKVIDAFLAKDLLVIPGNELLPEGATEHAVLASAANRARGSYLCSYRAF